MRNKTNIKIVPLLISLIFTVQLILVPSTAFAWVKSDGFGADTYNSVMTYFWGEGDSPYGSDSQVYGTGSGNTSDDNESIAENSTNGEHTPFGISSQNGNEQKIDWREVAARIRKELDETNTLSPLLEGLALRMGYVRVPVLSPNSTIADGTSNVDSPLSVKNYDGVDIPDPNFSFKDPSLADEDSSGSSLFSDVPFVGSIFSKLSDTVKDSWNSSDSLISNLQNVGSSLINNGWELASAAKDTFVAGITSVAGAVSTAIAGAAEYAMTMAKAAEESAEEAVGEALDSMSSRALASPKTTSTPTSASSPETGFQPFSKTSPTQNPSGSLLDKLMEKYTVKASPFEEFSNNLMEDFAQRNDPAVNAGDSRQATTAGGNETVREAATMRPMDYTRAKASVGSIPNFTNYVDQKVVQTIKNWVAGINGDYVGESLTNLASTIAYYAKEHKVDPLIMTALFTQESGFNPTARSYCGATGIAQFMPETAAGMGVDPYDVTSSINGACEYISNMMSSFGDYSLALAGYNAGGGAVQQYGGIPPYPETVNYVNSITDMWAKLKHNYDVVSTAAA